MTIDGHNHVGGPDKGDGYKQSPEGLIARMDEVGIDMAVIFPFNEINPGISFSLANDYIAKAVKKYPDRLIGFARLDPNYGERALVEVDRAINELGLKGIKLHPSGQDFSLDAPYVLKIIEKAAELEVPVIFDNGKPQSSNERIGRLAELVPEATIILAHMRGEGFIEVPKRFKNIYLGTVKAFNLEKIKEGVRALGAKRLISGSDSPYISMKKEIEKFNDIEGLSRKEKALIQGENMRRILKI